MSATRRTTLLVSAVGLACLGAAQWLGRTYGTTRAERRRRLPGDELCPVASVIAALRMTDAQPPP